MVLGFKSLLCSCRNKDEINKNLYIFVDAYLLPQSNISGGTTTVTGTERSPSDMFSTLSATGAQYSRPLTCYDSYLNNSFTTSATNSNSMFAFNNNSIHTESDLSTNPVNCATEIPRVAHNKENGGTGK